MNEEQRKCLAISFWAIWQIRNKVHHQREKLNTFGVITFIKSYQAENNIINIETSTATRQINSMWGPPRADMIKYNFDAAFCDNTFKSMMGILFKDYEGHILVACIYHNTFIAYATTAEAKAWLQAISVAEELGFRNLIVQGDSCSFVGQTMNQEVHVMAEEGKN